MCGSIAAVDEMLRNVRIFDASLERERERENGVFILRIEIPNPCIVRIYIKNHCECMRILH